MRHFFPQLILRIKTTRAFCLLLLLSRERDDDSMMMMLSSKAFSRGGGCFGGRHVPWCFGRKAAVVFWSSGNTDVMGKDDFDATTTTTQRSAASKNDFVDDTQKSSTTTTSTSTTSSKRHKSPRTTKKKIKELNGPKGLEPTRFTDWEVGGRCTDF